MTEVERFLIMIPPWYLVSERPLKQKQRKEKKRKGKREPKYEIERAILDFTHVMVGQE